jgi:cardiolipin synthase
MLSSVIASHFSMIAGVAMTLVLVSRMVRQRRSATSTTAWLMAILLIPWIGIPAYLVFGGRKLSAALMLKPPLGSTQPAAALPPGQAGADQLLQSYGLPRAQSGNRFSLCADGVDIYNRFIETIESAEKRIHMASFIRTRLASPLSRRWHGVRAPGSKCACCSTAWDRFDPLIRAGGEVAFFLPVRLVHFTRTNMRNHRKMLIADDQRAVAGGANVAVEYMGPKPDPKRWRDLSFLLAGSAVRDYAAIFAADWRFVTGERIDAASGPASAPGEAVVQIAPSGPDVPGDPVYAAIVSATFAARRRLWIVTPYFIPPEGLAGALALAAHRGVDVRVYVPDPSNHFIADLARGQPLRDAAAAGVSVIRFIGGMVHAKIVVVDDALAMVGSVNIDPRSLFLNFEANAIVYGADQVGAVANWIETLLDTK